MRCEIAATEKPRCVHVSNINVLSTEQFRKTEQWHRHVCLMWWQRVPGRSSRNHFCHRSC